MRLMDLASGRSGAAVLGWKPEFHPGFCQKSGDF